ncbi:MAG: hypothetical protein HGA65_01015 [Oscillochloris sp.]|nr:hypothetical protein [Oscillochloris sp.]
MSRQEQHQPASPQRGRSGRGFLTRVLDPVDRLVEAIYSILIVLSFTLAVGVIDVDGALAEPAVAAWVSQLFVAAFGCAVAWGLIDGAMYVVASRFERGQERRLQREVRAQPGEAAGAAVIADELERAYPIIASLPERQQLYQSLYRQIASTPEAAERVGREDLAGGLGIALIAILAALPVTLPLVLFPGDPALAVRISNLVACALLFWLGYSWARYAGGRPWGTGLRLLILGLTMVAVAIPLGG